MEKLIAALARPAVFLVGVIIMVLFLMLILPNEAAKAAAYTPDGASFDTSFFYTPSEVYPKIASYTAEGRAAYIYARWTFDLAFPFAYGFFCLTAIAFGGTRLPIGKKILRLWILLPILAIIFDLAENTAVSLAMVNFPHQSTFLAFAAAVATLTKWVFVMASFSSAVLLPALAGIKWALRHKSKFSYRNN